MYQIYQQYFKNKQYKFLLKYDGARDKKRYTIRVFDETDSENTYGKDTDLPEAELLEILNNIDIKIIPNKNIMYFDFMEIISSLKEKFGDSVICSLFFKHTTTELLIELGVIHSDSYLSYQSSDIDKIKAYIGTW